MTARHDPFAPALPTPPRTALIWAMIAIYLLAGLTGHAPWRGDDGRFFGPILGMVRDGHWLVPHLAGVPHLDFGPLYYWLGALSASALGTVLPLHDAARLASGLFAGLALWLTADAARRMHGERAHAPTLLLLVATLGLVVHVHETQPLLAVMAAQAVTLWGMATALKRPALGAVIAGAGVGLAALANGLNALLVTAPLLLLLPGVTAIAIGLLTAALVAGLWIVPMILKAPDLLAAWWSLSVEASAPHTRKFAEAADWLGLLGWFTWPLWPIAGWAFWRERRHLGTRAWRITAAAIVLAVLLTSLTGTLRPAGFLPLLLPLALAAAAGVTTLRRGAANAFDWFGGMTFATFALLAWTAWSAMAFDWPPGLARHLAKVTPNFALDNLLWPSLLALAVCASWIWLLAVSKRSPYRGAQNSAAGMTMLWCLAVILLQPWFDYSKGHASAVMALSEYLRAHPPKGCIAGIGLSPSLAVSLDYRIGLRPRPFSDTSCPWILVSGSDLPTTGTLLWHHERGGGNRREVLSLVAQPAR